MDFDEERIYYSHQNLQQEGDGGLENDNDQLGDLDIDDEDDRFSAKMIRRHFKEFLSKFGGPMRGPHFVIVSRAKTCYIFGIQFLRKFVYTIRVPQSRQSGNFQCCHDNIGSHISSMISFLNFIE